MRWEIAAVVDEAASLLVLQVCRPGHGGASAGHSRCGGGETLLRDGTSVVYAGLAGALGVTQATHALDGVASFLSSQRLAAPGAGELGGGLLGLRRPE